MTAPLPASPLRGRYLVQNPTWNAFLRVTDAALGALLPRAAGGAVASPRRVLLATGGHLGDAVIATSAIAQLRRAFPDVQIGIALATWARAAVDGHPELRWVHTVDHWKPNRSGATLPVRWLRDRLTRRRALREIRDVGYDVAVDLYMYYPNMAGLLWRAGIPVRVGFTSGGYGPLYTHRVEWLDGEDHTAVQHARLLRVLHPSLGNPDDLRYHLPPVPEAARRRADAYLRAAGVEPGEYLVMHMGSGSPLREWPVAKWRELAGRLTAAGHRLVFTGTGEQEEARVAAVTRGLPGCVSLTGRLGWHEFIHVLASAELVLCVETAASHVAAAVGTPCVALWTGITRLNHWRPAGEGCTVLMNEVPCAPCFRSRGCETMACVREVTVDAVMRAVQSHLRRVRPLALSS